MVLFQAKSVPLNVSSLIFLGFLPYRLQHHVHEIFFRDRPQKLEGVIDHGLGNPGNLVQSRYIRELLHLYHVRLYVGILYRHGMGHTGHMWAVGSGGSDEHLNKYIPVYFLELVESVLLKWAHPLR